MHTDNNADKNAPVTETIYTVSKLNQTIRLVLEQTATRILLVGEISNFSAPSSGHWYFTLKDTSAQVKAAMFRGNNRTVNFIPQNGMQVMVRATVTLYEPRGDYQIIVEKIKPAGEGMLQQQFEALKIKLSEEGLFAAQFKKPLPVPAKQVGVITSPTGAALQDILQVLKRRDPQLPIILYPSQVQGEPAVAQLIKMIEVANLRQECDVLILARGGGSLEDLWCFNNEALARAIFASKIPIISGVGHETDVTIADFVADVRAPTPSAAAELVSRNQIAMLENCQRLVQRLEFAMDYYLSQQGKMFSALNHRLNLQHPELQIARKLLKLNEVITKLGQLQSDALRSKMRLLNQNLDKLRAHNPYALGVDRLTLLKKRLALQNPISGFKPIEASIQIYVKRLHEQMTAQIRQHQQVLTKIDKAFYPIQSHLMNLKRADLAALSAKLKSVNLTQTHQSAVSHLHQKLYQFSPLGHIHSQQQHLAALTNRQQQSMKVKIETVKLEMRGHFGKLDALSPLKSLERGFAVVLTDKQERIKSRKQVTKGDVIETRVSDGKITSQILTINPL